MKTSIIPRPNPINQIDENFRIHSAVALLGPRQCGKTTLARVIAQKEPTTFFDLENPVDLQRLSAPMQALKDIEGLVVIDEVQKKPELFELLRVLIDRPDHTARYLLLGSASLDLIKGVSESLAGRIGFVELSGFQLSEIGFSQKDRLWMRGGLPRSVLADEETDSILWRNNYIRTFLERDIPQLGINIPSETLRRFWIMVSHYHANIWNASEIARSLGTSENTTRRYLDILAGSYMVRILPPWFENIKKRQVKSPKIYIRDSGLFHSLLQISDQQALFGHPKIGASWEGFALEQIITIFGSKNAYFWGTHAGAELDLLLMINGKRHGFDFKFSDAPGTSRSMHIAIDNLQLEHLWVIYPGSQSYPLTEKITALPLEDSGAIQ